MNMKQTKSLAGKVLDSPKESSFGVVGVGSHCNKDSVFNIELQVLYSLLGSAHLQEATNWQSSNGIPTSLNKRSLYD